MRRQDISINPYKQDRSPFELEYHDCFESGFGIAGFAFDNKNRLCRLPENLLHRFNEEIVERSYCTSGGVLYFETDSEHLAVSVSLSHAFSRPFMTLMACRGLDFYVGTGNRMEYFATAMPENLELHYEYNLPAVKKAMRRWTVYLPVFAGIDRLSVGIDKEAVLRVPEKTQKKRVVFYGSSITQGIVATRPGNTYVNQIGRKLDIEPVNLGFAGNARGEPEMADIIASIRMDAFVMDYDHNSPSCRHLEQTHERFFRIIREKNPLLPVIIVTKPDFDTDRIESDARRRVIYKTYENAAAAGDKNVYFIDGESLYGTNGRDCCTADNCHPNDLGFYRMSEKIGAVLKKVL